MIIRRIEPKRNTQKKRVAAYCRVSTDKAEQLESFETQTAVYREMITRNSDWTFIDVYADEGLSGTSANRAEFQRMMADAMAGKIDMILVKSISRFSRNTVDCQRYARELKSKNVEVFFEREGLSTLDPSTDMIFSLLGAVAQDESRSISENVKWTYQQNFEKGAYRMGNNRVLGYDMDSGGKLVPNGDAWIVRQVFSQYAAGDSLKTIADGLIAAGAKRLRSDKPFCSRTILSMLQNETYAGDLLLQEKAPDNHLTKKPDKGTPFTSQFFQDHHEPIIDRETWNRVKARLDLETEARKNGVCANSTKTHFLYGKVFCEECGAPYTRRTTPNPAGGHYKAWICRTRKSGKPDEPFHETKQLSDEKARNAKQHKTRRMPACMNRIVREEELLQLIATKMGDAAFNRSAFDGQVEKVLVLQGDVRVLIKEHMAS